MRTSVANAGKMSRRRLATHRTHPFFSEASPETEPRFKDLLGSLNQLYRNNLHYADRGSFGNVFVLDILKDGHTSVSVDVQTRLGGGPRWCTRILQHLR